MNDDPSEIAIVGTGNVGGALARRFTSSGYAPTLGVRKGKDVSELLSACDGKASVATPQEAAAGADVIFLAVPGSAAVEAARSLGDLSGKVLVDCNNILRWDAGPVWDPPPEGSLTAAIAEACPGARLVKAFNIFGSELHENPKLGETRVDVLMAGDDPGAKHLVSTIAERSGFNPIDAGPLRNAALLENLAVLWIHLAMVGGEGRNFAFKVLKRAPE